MLVPATPPKVTPVVRRRFAPVIVTVVAPAVVEPTVLSRVVMLGGALYVKVGAVAVVPPAAINTTA